MVRIALAAYLTLVTLLSPALCCCTSARVLAWFDARPAVGAHAPGGCHCHGTSSDNDAKSPARPKHTPCGDDSCPGQQHNRLAAILESDLQSTEQFGAQRADFQQVVELLDCYALPAAISSRDVTEAGTDESPTSPYLTARDILRALQIMRC